MWQTIIFFVVVNFLSTSMIFLDSKKTSVKISTFNKILYAFFGGAVGILLASKIFKLKTFKNTVVIVALIENIGIYILLYKLAIYFG